jgi:hypothetical protein
MPRSMTPVEKQRFRGYFPNLNVDATIVTGEINRVYNCISWTVGVTNRWLWPGPTIQQFDTLYRQFGFVRAGNGPIAVWGQSTSHMTHGSISGPGHGPRWESKCGGDLRIQHGLTELAGSLYGRVMAFYARGLALLALSTTVVEAKVKQMSATITAKESLAAKRIASEVDTEMRQAFRVAFAAWKKTWFEGGLAISSDPHTRAVGKDFDTLVALGPKILPLVIAELTDADNFFALQLYDVLQPNQHLIVQYEPDDERILAGEQGRAAGVVKHWLASHVTLE